MTRNLAIGCNGTGSTYGSSVVSRTLTSSDSHLSSNFTTPSSNPTATSSVANNRANSTIACSSTYGAWYNFIAATGGTVGTTSVINSDICPAGWQIPNDLGTSTKPTYKDISSYVSSFSPVTGGYWDPTTLAPKSGTTSSGHYWKRQYSGSGNSRNQVVYNGSSLSGGNNLDRGYAWYIRCARIP